MSTQLENVELELKRTHPVMRALRFLAHWAVLTLIATLALAGNDPKRLDISFEARMGYYLIWAIGVGLVLTLLEFPWKGRGALIDRKLFGK